jgi:hypothetical protein
LNDSSYAWAIIIWNNTYFEFSMYRSKTTGLTYKIIFHENNSSTSLWIEHNGLKSYHTFGTLTALPSRVWLIAAIKTFLLSTIKIGVGYSGIHIGPQAAIARPKSPQSRPLGLADSWLSRVMRNSERFPMLIWLGFIKGWLRTY